MVKPNDKQSPMEVYYGYTVKWPQIVGWWDELLGLAHYENAENWKTKSGE